MTNRRELTLDDMQPTLRSQPMRRREWNQLRDRPGAVSVGDPEVGELVLVPEEGQLRLYYSFIDLEALRTNFTEMFETLRDEIPEYGADYVVLDLVEVQNRDWLLPVLRDNDFEFFGEWMRMVHLDLDPSRVPDFPDGLRMRKGTPDDDGRIGELWQETWGDYAPQPSGLEALLEAAAWRGVLEDESGEIVAFAVNGPVEAAEGRLFGIGAMDGEPALLEHVVRAALYQLAAAEARKATTASRPDLPAITRVLRDAGFAVDRLGVEYRRTTDEEEIARVREERRVTGVKARFGGWR